jgi:hypothetical protein
MSLSVNIVAPSGWDVKPVRWTPDDVPFIGGTMHHRIRDAFGVDITWGPITPSELIILSDAIIERFSEPVHECNCPYCTYSGPDTYETPPAEWMRIARYFRAVADKGYAIDASY